MNKEYDRAHAVLYAKRWAIGRNPQYYDYEKIGGDCTNFVSQCLFAGSEKMNYARPLGWYYLSADNHSASWTGVEYLHAYLTRRSGTGPIGYPVSINAVQPGDLSQFAKSPGQYTHSQIIVSVGNPPSLKNIRVCAHSIDSINRPLSTYSFAEIRFVHIAHVVL